MNPCESKTRCSGTCSVFGGRSKRDCVLPPLSTRNIASVGVDTWGVDYVLVDQQDQIAGPVRHYRDARTRGMMERAFEIVSREQIFAATGLQFMEISTLYQLRCRRPGRMIRRCRLRMDS